MARIPDIVGCHTQGKSASEVMERIKEAIQACGRMNLLYLSDLPGYGVSRQSKVSCLLEEYADLLMRKLD